jgi:hypothetical protein
MEACWHVEFTGVELTGGVELATPVEKATTGLVEKTVASHSCGEGGKET